MGSYLLRRMLWMIPTFLGILLINFGLLRARANPLAKELNQVGGGGEASALDPQMMASMVQSALGKARRTGQDLPALLNLRGFLDREDVLAELRKLERDSEASPSERVTTERELWLAGRYVVEPLYQILDDPELREFHGVASQVMALAAYVPMNKELLAEMSVDEQRELRTRNRRLDEIAIRYRNTVAGGFAIDDPEYAAKLARIRAFWGDFRGYYQVSTGEAWWAVLFHTGFVDFFDKLLTGDLYSYDRERYVYSLIAERWQVTFGLQLISIFLAWSVSILVGIRSARRKGTLEDATTTNALFLLWSLPEFFVGTLLLHYLCTDRAGGAALFPARGLSSDDSLWMSTPRYILDVMWHAALPLLVLSYNNFTALSRYMRGNLLDQLGSDYVRSARAKGASEDRVVYKHALRNSMVTMITVGSTLLAALFGGFVVVEYIFSINGLGLLLLEAAKAEDAPLVMGATIVNVLLLLVSILIADILYAVADPRIRNAYV